MLVAFVVLAVSLRAATLGLSIRNERRLRHAGAVEIGARNSIVLASAHLAFYLAAIAEAAARDDAGMDAIAMTGIAIYGFGALMLVLVIRALGRFWTVRLMLAPDHALVATPLFRRFRHPNYFLNILPELVGLALALHAWLTLAIGLPLYAIPLAIRIRQEERAMRERFAGY